MQQNWADTRSIERISCYVKLLTDKQAGQTGRQMLRLAATHSMCAEAGTSDWS